jgi:hypothetical protein
MPWADCYEPRLAFLNLGVGHVRAEVRARRLHRIHLLSFRCPIVLLAREECVSVRKAEENELVVGIVHGAQSEEETRVRAQSLERCNSRQCVIESGGESAELVSRTR